MGLEVVSNPLKRCLTLESLVRGLKVWTHLLDAPLAIPTIYATLTKWCFVSFARRRTPFGEQKKTILGVIMQVQLIVADEQRKGQVIPVNVPSFMIGRAEGCNLRSRSAHVSRFHCTIAVNNGVAMVQDLGGENGTFVNGNRVQSVQKLRDGDKLVVGTHSFVVSIKERAEQSEPASDNFFELSPSAISQSKAELTDATCPVAYEKPQTATTQENAQSPKQEAEIMFEIRLDGQRISVTKSRLFDLARKGSILPDDLVTVAGTKVFADSIQGIFFGNKSVAVPTPPPAAVPSAPSAHQPLSAAVTPAAPKAAPSDAAPFAFPEPENADESSPFDGITSEPFARAVRKESAFAALWNALDISFSRVYTMEGNNLVIHSLKALYYVLVVSALLVIGFMWFDVGAKCYESENPLSTFSSHFVGLSVVTFGCITIIVIVRVLLEMLLLAWIESSRTNREGNDEDE